MPPKNKSKNAPNQHDKRHESGLAPPGKRVNRKTSNGQLNGSPNGKTVPAPALPSTGLNSGFKFPRPADNLDPAAQTVTRDHAVPLEGTERDRVCSDASLEEGGQCDEMGDCNVETAAAAAPSIGVQLPTYNAATPKHGNGRLAAISTILSYYPLRDAISILILLLSLPPTLVLVIQTLFASLTFVPPTASISLSTLPNIKEMFNSSNFGYPALATILFVDLMFWFIWALVWKPVQNVFLDLSQAVIAVSLSGAAASTGGPTYSIATTTIIVCVVHVLRYRAIHLTALDYLRSVIHKMDIGIQFDAPSFATTLFSSPSLERSSFQTTMRIILGIHIVSQGVTTCIRRSLVKANEQSANTPAITKTDPEATVGSETSRSNTGLAEASQHATSAINSDGRPPGPSPAHSDNKLRETNGKKKRKQANQVRSQQPLWAAIASTKVTFVKEMEQRESADDAREASKMDTTATSTHISNTNHTSNRIWICEVRDTETLFSVELSPFAVMETAESIEEGKGVSAGLDRSKPFFIRINGAAWSSTRIMSSSTEGDSAGQKGDQYDGEIFGLAPLSNYHCEVVAIASQKVLCSASIITQPAPTAEQAASSSQPQHQALRPSSPITTLKQSIVSAEARLNDTRNRSRKTKKDLRNAQSEIRKEVNSFKSKVESSGGADDKLERRIAQITQHKNQADDAAAELKSEMDALGDIPSDELAQSEAKKRKWQSANSSKHGANKELENAKSEGDRDINNLRAEQYQAKAKREKAATRLQQRAEELEKLTSKQQADMTAKQKREYDRAALVQQRDNDENMLQYSLATMEAETQGVLQKAHETYAEIATVQSWPGQPPPYPGHSQPPTPENVHAGMNGALASPQTTAFPSFNPTQFNQSFHTPQASMSQQQQQPPPQTRGRSSSMLSAYSGFTDGADDNLLPPEHRPQPYNWNSQPNVTAGAPRVLDDRKESEGSGNSGSLNGGSTGSNSPRPEAKVFVPGSKAAAPLSPIGPPSGKGKEKGPQSPLQNHANAGYGPVR